MKRVCVFPESVCEGFFVKSICRTTPPLHLHIFTSVQSRCHLYFCSSSHLRTLTSTSQLNYTSSTSSHLHLCTITLSPLSLLIFTSAHPHIYISAHLHLHASTSLLIFTSARLHLCSSSHPHIYISHPHLSLFLTFSLKAGVSAAGPPRNATLCGDRACRVREMQARMRFVSVRRNPLRRSCVSSARNAGESAICLCRGQPSAEIVRVECVKCRRECDSALSRATFCGDRACRVRETQARVRFGFVRRNPLRRSCVSSARNAGESAIGICPAQPSAEMVRVESAKCRRGCGLDLPGATLCGDRARRVREMQARVRFGVIAGNRVRRSCVSSAQNAGESAICPGRGQPSAEIVRVECAKCKRECDSDLSRATLCGDRVCRVREMQVRVRFVSIRR